MTFKKKVTDKDFKLTKYKSEHSHELGEAMTYDSIKDGRSLRGSSGRPRGCTNGDSDMTNYFMSKIRSLETDLISKNAEIKLE